MKKLFWKPGRTAWQIHVLIALFALAGLAMVEIFKVNIRQPYYSQKIKAARIMKSSMDSLKSSKIEKFGPIDRNVDPMVSGIIGELASPITSSTVDIDAKYATLNPNWAASVVLMLKKAKVQNGATVAVSFTGSFPAINLAVLSAAKALDLKLLIITSVASSTWGANNPNFTWLDMESDLNRKGIFTYKSFAASYGGVKDNALGITPEGKRLIRESARRNRVPFIEYENISDNLNARMDLYHEKAGDSPISAFINVGGGTVAVGTFIGKRRFEPGLNLRPGSRALQIDSLMSRFARDKAPVINLNYMKTLARKYGLPDNIKTVPVPGTGEIFYKLEYNRIIVYSVLAGLVILIVVLIRLGVGYRIFTHSRKEESETSPGQMV